MSAQGIAVKRSTVSHPICRLRLFAAWIACRGEVMEYYFGFPVYANLFKEEHMTKTYRVIAKKVTIKTFLKWTNHLPDKRVDKQRVQFNVWMVLAPLYVMRYIHVSGSLLGDTTLETVRVNKPPKNNVQFLQCSSLSSPENFRWYIFFVQPLGKTDLGEALIMPFGNKYEFYASGILW